MIGKTIYSKITADSTLAGLVSTRVYPGYADPKAVYPFVTYDIISNVPNNSKGNTSHIDNIRVQINVIAKTYAEVVSIANRIRVVLDNYSGTVSGGLAVRGTEFDGENDLIHDEDAFGRALDFIFQVKK